LILPRFGATPLAAITQPSVQPWVADLLARGLAAETVVKAYQLFGRTMTAAVNADMLARSPCRAVRPPKIERRETRFLNPPRSPAWPTPSVRATGRWFCWRPTAACASGSRPAYGAVA
jgi:hypothetical protein